MFWPALWSRALQGSALQRTITSSIREIRNDSATGLQELEDVVDQWGSSFDFISTSAAFTKAANLRRVQPVAAQTLLNTLAGIWDSVLPDAGLQALSNVLWACGKLRYPDQQLWSSTLEAFLLQMEQGQDALSGLDVANVLVGMANVAVANKGQVPGVPRADLEAAVVQIGGCMRVLVTHPLLEGVDAQGVANVLWACAKLRINPGDAVLNSMLQAMARPALLETAVAQHLSNALWAVSELQRHCSWQPQVQQRVWERLLGEQQLRRIADKGDRPQALANTLLALAHLSFPAAAAAAAAVAPTISNKFAQECVLQLMQGELAQQVSLFNAQDLGNSMWACAKLNVYDTGFMQIGAAAAPQWMPGAAAAAVSQIAYACKTLQHRDTQLMLSIVQHSKLLLKKRGSQSSRVLVRMTAVVADAVAALNMPQLADDVKDIVASSGVTDGSTLNRADAGMLWDVHSWLVQHQLLDGQGLVGLLSQQQLEHGRVASEAHHAQQFQQQQGM
jgi:hypothetical protein